MVTYDALVEEVEAIKGGGQKVLTEAPVLMLEKTSGSTAAAKYIPYTIRLKREFQAAVAPWMADLHGRRPKMFFGGAYWSVSPLAAEREATEGSLPVGFEDETEYFGSFERRLLRRLLLTPPELPRIPDIETCRYVTLRFLLANPHLTFISVWSPSFLTLLMRCLEEHGPRLIRDIRDGTLSPPVPLPPGLQAILSQRLAPLSKRARLLDGILKHHGKLFSREIWPSLAVISCWASASASRFLPELRQLFPEVEIQPKGLLATEGVISIPLTGHPGAALAATSHFLEFVDADKPHSRPLVADEIEAERVYSVIITTGGGLYRYALGDRVRVVGRVKATPLVEFVGRAETTSDLCGEKLHETPVRSALEKVLQEFHMEPSFVMIAPEWGEPPGYVIFIEGADLHPHLFNRFVSRVEAELSAGPHYAYCRRLGQLRPLAGLHIRSGGNRAYMERCAAMGQRHGNIKPTVLHRETGWSEWFRSSTAQRPYQEMR
jgi:hypothetical protein